MSNVNTRNNNGNEDEGVNEPNLAANPTPTQEESPSVVTVETGDTSASLEEKHGLSQGDLYRLNSSQMDAEATARGFGGAAYQRTQRDEQGNEKNVAGHHVFTGQQLRVKPED